MGPRTNIAELAYKGTRTLTVKRTVTTALSSTETASPVVSKKVKLTEEKSVAVLTSAEPKFASEPLVQSREVEELRSNLSAAGNPSERNS